MIEIETAIGIVNMTATDHRGQEETARLDTRKIDTRVEDDNHFSYTPLEFLAIGNIDTSHILSRDLTHLDSAIAVH